MIIRYENIARRVAGILPERLKTPLAIRLLLGGGIVLATVVPVVERPADAAAIQQIPWWVSMTALVLLMAYVVAAAGMFLYIYDRKVYDRLRDLTLIATLFVGMVWITRVAVLVWPEISPFVLPVPLAAMLGTMLLSAREGLLIAMITTVAGLLLGFTSGSLVIATLVWSIAAVTAMAFWTERRRVLVVGVSVVLTGVLAAFLATLAEGLSFGVAVQAAGYAAVGGALSAILAYGLLPFFESVFGLTTDLRLLELGSPAHPLMRELMLQAPGTYAHSVATANLAESAAEAVGAKPLLARVGAYYHDIGKIRRPGFFYENLQGGENPHDDTRPTLSALIITSHVRDGSDLAKQYKLPEEIEAIIRQHHGTSLVSYFYSKAAESDAGVFEADFRYQGEKPQSPEAALVMLADGSEAAVRALKKPSSTRVEATVRKVVDEKLADGQLDDADLTLADIERIVKTYSRMLTSMFHARCEYPATAPRRPAHADKHNEPQRA
ncbi:MAG: HDIG domain-containing protein [Coriobacteriales bacterium]|nr:HDIG domain-containing protein [Coriobacteriales bacterium]